MAAAGEEELPEISQLEILEAHLDTLGVTIMQTKDDPIEQQLGLRVVDTGKRAKNPLLRNGEFSIIVVTQQKQLLKILPVTPSEARNDEELNNYRGVVNAELQYVEACRTEATLAECKHLLKATEVVTLVSKTRVEMFAREVVREIDQLTTIHYNHYIALKLPRALASLEDVMLFLSGGNYGDTATEPMLFAAIQEVISGLLEALAALSACGIIHRDVKPANILIAVQGFIQLADFGSSARNTANGVFYEVGSGIGTKGWSVPALVGEAELPAGGYSFEADLFPVSLQTISLGAGMVQVPRKNFPIQPLRFEKLIRIASDGQPGYTPEQAAKLVAMAKYLAKYNPDDETPTASNALELPLFDGADFHLAGTAELRRLGQAAHGQPDKQLTKNSRYIEWNSDLGSKFDLPGYWKFTEECNPKFKKHHNDKQRCYLAMIPASAFTDSRDNLEVIRSMLPRGMEEGRPNDQMRLGAILHRLDDLVNLNIFTAEDLEGEQAPAYDRHLRPRGKRTVRILRKAKQITAEVKASLSELGIDDKQFENVRRMWRFPQLQLRPQLPARD